MADQRTAISRVIEANAVHIVQSIIVTPLFKAHLIQKKVFTAEATEAIFKVSQAYSTIFNVKFLKY